MNQRDDTLHEQYFGHEHLTVIEPSKGWCNLDLKELWAYRELLWVLTLREGRCLEELKSKTALACYGIARHRAAATTNTRLSASGEIAQSAYTGT